MSISNAIKKLQIAKAIRAVAFSAKKPGFGDTNDISMTFDTKTIGTLHIDELKTLTSELNEAMRPVLDRHAASFVDQATKAIEADAISV